MRQQQELLHKGATTELQTGVASGYSLQTADRAGQQQELACVAAGSVAEASSSVSEATSAARAAREAAHKIVRWHSTKQQQAKASRQRRSQLRQQ